MQRSTPIGETRRASQLPDPPCGMAVYRSNPEDQGQRVCITYHDGVQVAIVMDGEDEGEEVPVDGMAGSFER